MGSAQLGARADEKRARGHMRSAQLGAGGEAHTKRARGRG